jgi:uncharacterized protein YndB with AHSA1/START domain
MLERQVVIPASTSELWEALTDTDALSAWFGSRVSWDLRPGGDAHFLDHDGTARHGVIDAVLPGRHLSFRWWRDDEGDNGASVVTYRLEPDEGGTRLTVTEAPVPVAAAGAWTAWDSRLFGCWARAAARISC